MNAGLPQTDAINSFAMANGSLSDDFGFTFDEAWQDFPATTLDFLTSQWQDSTTF